MISHREYWARCKNKYPLFNSPGVGIFWLLFSFHFSHTGPAAPAASPGRADLCPAHAYQFQCNLFRGRLGSVLHSTEQCWFTANLVGGDFATDKRRFCFSVRLGGWRVSYWGQTTRGELSHKGTHLAMMYAHVFGCKNCRILALM